MEIGKQLEVRCKARGIGRPKVRCLLMQKDEADLLPLWIRYHGELFGYQNLFIYDNGSGPKTLNILHSCEQHFGVHVDYSRTSKVDFESKGDIFGEQITRWSMDKQADFYFPLDCDEFVGISLEAGYSCSPELINNGLFLLNQRVHNAAFQVSERLDNSWHDETVFHRIPRARKLFFANSDVLGLCVGFHQCQYPSNVEISNIVYFHFHNRPFDQLREASKRKLQLRLPDLNSITTSQLKDYKGPGVHLIRSLACTSEEYAQWLRSHPYVQTTALSDRFSALGFNSPWMSKQKRTG